MKLTLKAIINIFLYSILVYVLPASATPQVTTYQAKILKPDGLPLDASSVSFKFTILSPDANCILYSETYASINMSGTGGMVTMPLGTGTKVYPASATTFAQVFNNSTPSLDCAPGGPADYQPGATDVRKIVMQFNDGNGWQTLPAMSINAVPYAIYASDSLSLGGVSATSYIKYSTIPTCTASQALQYNGVGFSCIAAGGASGTVTAGDITTALGYTPVNPASLSTSFTTTASFSTVTATVSSLGSSVTAVASTVNGLSASLATIVSSQWNTSGTTINYQTGNVGIGTTTPATRLDVSGGVRIGAESTTCAPALAGTLRYNSGNVEYCNGTSWSAFGVSGAGLQSLNGSTSGTQIFATGTGGIAPNIVTANGVHTFNIPLASAGSVTAGLISNADYSTFNNKITSSAASIAEVLGYIPTNSSTLGGFATISSLDLGSASATGTLSPNRLPAYSGDVTSVSGSAVLTLANSGVASGTYTKVSVDSKGRVTSGSQFAASDIATALGYTPANSATVTSSQWNTSGTTINYMSGNVGIGTTTPVTKLEVSGGVRISMESASCAVGLAGTLRYNTGNVEFCNGTTWSAFGVSGAGLQSLNGSTSGTQSFANGVAGNAPSFATANGIHTLNIPLASAGSVTAGLISNADYTSFSNKITSSAVSIAQVLGYTPASSTALENYLVKSSNLSDLASSATARSNLGLGSIALLNSIDLGSAEASGTLAIARLPSFNGDATIAAASNTIILSNSGVTAGTYTKLTVDNKGRVTSSSALVSNDVTTALGYTPASASASTQWTTSGTNIHYTSGNVGIGTTTPVTKLEVSGGVRISMESATCAVSYAGTLRYNAGNVEYCNGTSWSAFGVSGAGLQSFNGSASGTQSFAVGTGGTAPNFVTTNGVHTLDIPYASVGTTTAGLISTSDYQNFSNKITSSAASIAQVLGYTPASATALGNYLVKSNNLSDLGSSATARSNLGLGLVALLNAVDLGTSDATGTLAIARLPAFIGDVTSTVASSTLVLSNSGVTAGTYTKVTVDVKGRVTSSAALASSDVTTALGYTPAASGSFTSSQWTSSGSAVYYNTGNVGVGTNAPVTRLDVSGGVRISMEAATCAVSFAGTLRYNSGSVEYCNGSTWSAFGVASSGLTSLNGSASQTQTFATGITGTVFNISSANGVHTFNIPLAASGSVTAGLLSNADYVAFTNKVSSTSASVIAALGYVPANESASGTYAQKANNLSDLASATVARTNLGLGSLAILNFVDLSGAQASGTLAAARLPAFSGDALSSAGSAVLTLASVGSGVTSGTQYTKVTVDGKGRVTSGAQLSTSDVTTALGYTPASASASTQWLTSGSTISYSAGNVGIGTTTPRARLDVSGSVTIGNLAANDAALTIYTQDSGSVSHGIVLIDKDAGYGSWQNPSGLDGIDADSSGTVTGWGELYLNFYSTGDINFNSGGGDSKFNGRIAVGGFTPTAKLHIAGGTSSTAALKFVSGTLLSTPQTGAVEYNGINFYITDGTGTRRVIATSSSSGTINVTGGLNVSGSSVMDGSLKLSSMTSGSVLFAGASGTVTQNNSSLYWGGARLGIGSNSPSQTLSVSGTGYFSGNVGIGTTSPLSKLHVQNGGIQVRTEAADTASGLQTYRYSSDTVAPNILFRKTRGTEASPAYTLDSDGIGQILFQNRDFNSSADIIVFGAGTHSASNSGGYMVFRTATSGTTAVSERMRITDDGRVGIGTTSPGYKLDVSGTIRGFGITDSSDIRLKKDIEPLDLSLEKILKINGVSYHWKDQSMPKKQIGFIAQQLEKVYPELVETDNKGMKSVNYSHLVAPVIEAIKTLYKRILGVESHNVEQDRQIASIVESKADKAEIEVLRERLDKLEAENAAKAKEIEALKSYLCSKDPAAPICK